MPPNVNIQEIQKGLKSLSEIVNVHDCHVWSMDREYHVLTAHIVLDKTYNLNQLVETKSKNKLLLKELGIIHSTLEFEVKDEDCKGC